MPIQVGLKQAKTDGKESLTVIFDNGDLKALEMIEEKWNFKNKESFFRYAMAIFLSTEDKQLWVKADGQSKAIMPVDDLLKSQNRQTSEKQ